MQRVCSCHEISRTDATAAQVSKSGRLAAKYPLGVISGLVLNEKEALMCCETFNGGRVQLAQSCVVCRRRCLPALPACLARELIA
jgi:hypothetical protein